MVLENVCEDIVAYLRGEGTCHTDSTAAATDRVTTTAARSMTGNQKL